MASLNDHDKRIIELEKQKVNCLNSDTDIDNIIFDKNYYNNEEYDSLAKEINLFKVSDMNSIINSLNNKTPISNDIPDKSLKELLHYTDNTDDIIFKNSNLIYNKDIKKLSNVSNVKDIFSNSYCNFIQTYDNELFSFGYGADGQLGDGTTTSGNGIHKVKLPKKTIKCISAFQGRSNFVLFEDNEIYGWGLNANGCLGLGHSNKVLTPEKVIDFNSPVKQIISKGADNGSAISAILLENGELYVCGYNGNHELGFSHTTSQSKFVLNNYDFGSKPVKICINSQPSYVNLYVLTENGDIFSTGHNQYYSQLDGKTGSSSVAGFTKCEILPKNEKVIDFMCADMNNYCIVTDKGNTYCYGFNYLASLGTGNSDALKEFIVHPIIRNKKIICMSGNYWVSNGSWYPNTVIVTEDYKCYFGGHMLSHTALAETDSLNYMKRLNICGEKIKKVTTGTTSRMFLTVDGKVYILSNNQYGETLGNTAQTGYPSIIPYDFGDVKHNYETRSLNIDEIDESRLIDIF